MLRAEDKKKFAEILQFLAKRFCKECKNNKLDKQDLASYWFLLKDEFDNIKEFEMVAIKVGKAWKYGRMPEPNEFIDKLSPDNLSLEIIAQKAWQSVLYALDKGVGYTKTAEFEDGLIPLIVENFLGGFGLLGTLEFKDTEFKKKEFLKLYENLTKKRSKIKRVEVRAKFDDVDKIFIKADYPTLKTEAKRLNDNKTQVIIKQLVNKVRVV